MASVVIDMTKLKANLSQLDKRFLPLGIEGYNQALLQIFHHLQRQSQQRFDTQTDHTGTKWHPLTDATANWRRSQGYRDNNGYSPINRRTNDLMNMLVKEQPEIFPAPTSLLLMYPGPHAQAKGNRGVKVAQAHGQLRDRRGRKATARPVIGLGADDLGAIMAIASTFFTRGLEKMK